MFVTCNAKNNQFVLEKNKKNMTHIKAAISAIQRSTVIIKTPENVNEII